MKIRRLIYFIVTCSVLSCSSNNTEGGAQTVVKDSITDTIQNSHAETQNEASKTNMLCGDEEDFAIRDSCRKISIDAYFKRLGEEEKNNSFPYFGDFEYNKFLHHSFDPEKETCACFWNFIKIGQFYLVQFISGIDCERVANVCVVNRNFEITDSKSVMVFGCEADVDEDDLPQPEKDTLGHYLFYLDFYANSSERTNVNLTDKGFHYSDETNYILEDMDTNQKFHYEDIDSADYKVDKKGLFVGTHYQRGLSLDSIMKYRWLMK